MKFEWNKCSLSEWESQPYKILKEEGPDGKSFFTVKKNSDFLKDTRNEKFRFQSLKVAKRAAIRKENGQSFRSLPRYYPSVGNDSKIAFEQKVDLNLQVHSKSNELVLDLEAFQLGPEASLKDLKKAWRTFCSKCPTLQDSPTQSSHEEFLRMRQIYDRLKEHFYE